MTLEIHTSTIVLLLFCLPRSSYGLSGKQTLYYSFKTLNGIRWTSTEHSLHLFFKIARRRRRVVPVLEKCRTLF
ncbi:hypothetical protein EMCRGX_G034315 [Ephydatia muelleri]